MKTAVPVGVFLIAVALAGPAAGQASSVFGGIEAKSAVKTEDTHIKPVQGPDHSEGAAEEMRLSGQCDKAAPILRSYASRGAGYEIAQFNLGMCLLDLAAADRDAAQQTAMRKEGATWIVQSANGGAAKAQAEAATLYLDGTGVAADPVEAEKWALLYRHNSTRMAIGLPDIASEVSDRLDAALTDAQRDHAQELADAWTQAAQTAQAADQ